MRFQLFKWLVFLRWIHWVKYFWRSWKTNQIIPRQPKYSSIKQENPTLMVIFRICLSKRTNNPVACKHRPFGVKTTSTFIVDQASSNTKHPYDFDADDSMGAAKKRKYVRFYKVERDKGNDNMTLSSEITPKYNSAGVVVGGTYKSRNHSTWVTNICSF